MIATYSNQRGAEIHPSPYWSSSRTSGHLKSFSVDSPQDRRHQLNTAPHSSLERSAERDLTTSRLAALETNARAGTQIYHHNLPHSRITREGSIKVTSSTYTAPPSPGYKRSQRPSSSASTPPSLGGFHSPITDSYFAPQVGSLSFEARSPLNKRAPASRSSHGIETFTGPPPALSTQRSYTNEIARKTQSTVDPILRQQWMVQPEPTDPIAEGQPSKGMMATHRRHSGLAKEVEHQDSLSQPDKGMKLSCNSRDEKNFMQEEEDRDCTLRVLQNVSGGNNNERNLELERSSTEREGDLGSLGNDDLFLNLAHSTPSARSGAEEPSDRKERRRSRIALTKQRSSLTPDESTQELARHSTSGSTEKPETSPNILTYRSPTRDVPTAGSVHPLDDTRSPRYSTITHQASFSTLHSPKVQQQPPELTVTPLRGHAYRKSNLSFSAPRNHDSSTNVDGSVGTGDYDRSSETPHADDTESTTSTTAPSTVWDELDDLKSRIRKLELTGKVPSTSGAAISNVSGERPRTSTTTITTMSPSPKHGHGGTSSPPHSLIGGSGAANIHPLLHAALAKSKTLIRPEVYRALEATSSDALSLAAMMSNTGPQGTMTSAASVLSGAGLSERQARRKADSTCRSLTELCITLCDGRTETASPPRNVTPSLQSENRDGPMNHGPRHDEPLRITYQKRRAFSEEPEGQALARSDSRALSRLEARRTSLIGLNVGNSPRGPTTDMSTPTQESASSPKRPTLTSNVPLRARRGHDGKDEAAARAPSRTMTEVGQSRNSPREHVSREYTSRHPLPDRSPSVQSSTPLRKHYFSSSISPGIVPLTASASEHGAGRKYLDRSAAVGSDRERESTVPNTIASDRAQRVASMGQYGHTGRIDLGNIGRTGSFGAVKSRQANIEFPGAESRYVR
ncbi:MAG: hypothetical protein M1827_006818 [Pycnora praestabilis]|nr:MAG: hypothetical protein M1827_006818 [Pycnora praestabilis]